MVAKWLYQQKRERAHLALRRGRLAALETCLLVHIIHVFGDAALPGVTRWIEVYWDGMCHTRNPPFPLFQWCMCHFRHSLFQQGWLAAGQWDPSGDWVAPPCLGVQSNSAIPLQIPVDNFFPRHDGTWCSQQHSTMLIHGENQGNDCFQWLSYLYGVWCLSRGPQSGIWGNRSVNWLIN